MTSVDVSMCVDITDSAIVTLAQNCPRLKHLNLCGTSRVTDKGIQAVCANCWYLETLNVEDVFLFDDAAFWFDPHMDGRSLADEKMLTLLSTLNLRDCVCVTDHGIKGLASRCRSLQRLILRGCDRITDKGLKYMTLTVIERLQHKQCMCESLKSLDLSFCSNVTAGNVASLLLPLCPGLQELHLSGILDVDDDIVRQVCQNCPSIQTLSLQKCMLVSDSSLCWMADYLWLEALDISGCYKVTDDGLDVLTLACTGLQYMHVRRCAKITGRGVTCVGRNLFPLGLRILDLRDCPKVTLEAILDLQHKQRLVRLL